MFMSIDTHNNYCHCSSMYAAFILFIFVCLIGEIKFHITPLIRFKISWLFFFGIIQILFFSGTRVTMEPEDALSFFMKASIFKNFKFLS